MLFLAGVLFARYVILLREERQISNREKADNLGDDIAGAGEKIRKEHESRHIA